MSHLNQSFWNNLRDIIGYHAKAMLNALNVRSLTVETVTNRTASFQYVMLMIDEDRHLCIHGIAA